MVRTGILGYGDGQSAPGTDYGRPGIHLNIDGLTGRSELMKSIETERYETSTMKKSNLFHGSLI